MLNQIEPEKILKEIPDLEEQAFQVSRGIHKWVLEGGTPRRIVVDLLHGTWLGHPLHPVLTDVTIGAWLFSYVLDVLGLTNDSKGIQRAADTLLDIGNASAVGTALAGIADFSTMPRKAVSTGAVHGILNATGLVLNLLSSASRKQGNRGLGFALSSIVTSTMLISAWLGGEMTYKYRVGVNKRPLPAKPEEWTVVMDAYDLGEQEPVRVEIEGNPILLYRFQGEILAIGAMCAHEGGPLDEGSFDGYCVTCPWHQSVFDLRDGSVVHGPSTYAAPEYEVRILHEKIEVRVKDQKTASRM